MTNTINNVPRELKHHERCLSCDGINTDPSGHGARFSNRFDKLRFCTHCGGMVGWRDSADYWTSTAKLSKPWTWFSGYWTEKVADHE